MDESAFLAAIAADPDDDGAWHVYADWLEEQGDPRCELLRLHLERAGLADGDERLREVDARIDVVAHEHWEPCDTFGGFRRHGLMTTVGMTGAEFLDDADHVFSRHPVHGLTLTRIGAPRMAECIAGSPWLGRLRMLGFVGDERAREVVRVLQSDHLRGLEELVVRTKRIGKTVVTAICEMVWLRRLALYECNLDASRLRQLAENARFASLDELDLRGNWRIVHAVGAANDLEKLAERLKVRTLRWEGFEDRAPTSLEAIVDADSSHASLPGFELDRDGFHTFY